MKTVFRLLLVSAFFATGVLRAQIAGRPELDFNPNVTLTTSDGQVNSVATQFDGGIVVGGSFDKIGTTPRSNIARLNPDGSVDTTFNPRTGPSSAVSAVAVQPDGKILIGGGFATYDGTPCKNLTRLNPDGTLDGAFLLNLGTGPDSAVSCIAVQPDGKIVLGGFFANINGQARGCIARLNPDGTVESTATFNPGAGIATGGSVRALAVQPDGKIVIGGSFGTVSGQTHSQIARLNANGSLDATFNPGTITDGGVLSLALQADGKILLGGAFLTINSQPRSRVARLTATGALDPFSPPDVLGDVNGIVIQADGKFAVIGRSGTNLGTSRTSIARFNGDGTPESTATFDPGTGLFGNGLCAIQQSDGRILAAGSFTMIDVQFRNSLGRLVNGDATQSLAATDKTRAQWLRGGTAPEVTYVTFELSTDGGNTWTALGQGARIAGGWELTGLSLPASGLIRARGRMIGSSPALAEQVQAFTVDVSTQPPTLTAPATGTTVAHALAVSYLLPEPALAGTVQLSFTKPGTSRVLTLAPAGEGAGAHAFTFDPANPTASPAFATAAAIPDGAYSVSLSYRDGPGNAAATSAVVTAVTVDTTAPVLHLPAPTVAEAASAAGAVVNFAVSATDNSDPNPALSVVPASGGLFPLGVTTVNVGTHDSVGNTQGGSFTVTVRDTTPPAIGGNFAKKTLTTGADGTATLPDFLAQATITDAVGVVSATQNPPAGSAQPAGITAVTINAADAAGNMNSVSFNVLVIDGTPPAIAAPPTGFSPLILAAGDSGTAALPDFSVLAIVSDNVGVISLTQSPPPGSARAPGVTPVTIIAADAAGNSSSVNFNVTVVDVTAPSLAAPSGGFTPLTIGTGPDGTATLPDYTAQAVSGDNVAVTSLTQSPVPGSAVGAGLTIVTLTARDAAQNTGTLSFDVNVADATKPVITAPAGGFSAVVAQPDGTAALPDFTAEATATDNVGVVSFTQDPPAGTVRPFGKIPVTLTALDAAGNRAELDFDAFITLPTPLREAIVATGEAVPGAGVDPRIAADAVFTSLGIPAVDDARGVAFLGKWSSSSGSGAGIFAGNPAALVVAAGDAVPGIAGAKFKVLQDPLLAPGGGIAFGATVQGGGVNIANDQGVWVGTSAGIALALREGGQAPGAPAGALVKSIVGISLRDGELLARCTLLPRNHLVTSANDSVLLRITDTGASLLLRAGSLLDLDGTGAFDRIVAFDTLLPAAGSPGQGRWHGDGYAGARVALPGKRSALVQFGPDGSVQRLLQSGDAADRADPTAYWFSFGLPAFDTTGRGTVVKAVLRSVTAPGPTTTITPTNHLALAFEDDISAGFSIFARKGAAAPVGDGAIYSTFLDPVINNNLDVAFGATLTGPAITAKRSRAMFWGAPDALKLLAQSGSSAPDSDGAPTTALWDRFISYALPDGPGAGPVFIARLAGAGIAPANNLGVWAVDSTGLLRRLLRTGDTLKTTTIIGIDTLAPVPGALGAWRGFNARGTLVARVMLAGGGHAIVRIDVPDGHVRNPF